MGNEKYLNYYIETLTSTMTDCVIRNVSMQANAKVSDDVIKDLNEKIESLLTSNDELNVALNEVRNSNLQNENAKIAELQRRLDEEVNKTGNVNDELNELRMIKSQYENIKNQVSHLETFRNELNKSREETVNVKKEYETKLNEAKIEHDKVIEQLNSKIEYLQLTPAKRKKIDELNNSNENTLLSSVETIKDGGSF